MGIETGNRNGVLRLRSLLLWAGVLAGALFVVATSAQAFSAARVYREAASSVVLIFGFEDSGAGSSGTGSILTRDGLVLTNNHVIARGESGKLYSNLVVYFKPNPISGDNRKDLTKPFLVDVIARDAELDLALLRVKNAPPGLRPLPIGNSEEVDIGENVAAIGHPGGGGLWTLTTGTVSSKRRDQKRDIFQTDTAINPGNSGGPLLDEYARLVGVNTFVRRVNEQGLPLEGLNYSLRSSLALAWVNRQGAGRVGAVSRASAQAPTPAPAPRSEPAPAPRAEPAPEPAPRAEATPEPEPAPRGDVAPSRMLGDQPETAPEAPPAPAPQRAETPPPAPAEPEAREFVAPDGTRMYGVPNLENDLNDSLMQVREAYAELTKRRDKSINEMEKLFDDYDNF
ncbi:MAG: serine protease [bacterium]|nr:serine protease [bacterium]